MRKPGLLLRHSLSLFVILSAATAPAADVTTEAGLTRETNRYATSATLRTSGTLGANSPEGIPPINLGAGTLELTHPIDLWGPLTIRGMGAATYVHAKRGPAVLVRSAYGHGDSNRSTLESMTIVVDEGDAIATDDQVNVVERLAVRDVTVRAPKGWGVRLTPKSRCYFTVISGDFTDCWGAARIDGVQTVLRDFRVQGRNAHGPRPDGMVWLTGSATIEGASRLEGAFGCPLLKVEGYLQDPDASGRRAMYPSTLKLRDAHFEPSAPGVVGDLSDVRFISDELPYDLPHTPWRIGPGVNLDVRVRPDETGLIRAPATRAAQE